MANAGGEPKSLPLILARELGANLATPMFLIDKEGTLAFYNEAAELLIGRPFAELGEIPALDFGEELRLRDSDGSPLRRARYARRDRLLRTTTGPQVARRNRV